MKHDFPLPFTDLRFRVSVTPFDSWRNQGWHTLWHAVLAFGDPWFSIGWALAEEVRDGILKPDYDSYFGDKFSNYSSLEWEDKEGFNVFPDLLFRGIGIVVGSLF